MDCAWTSVRIPAFVDGELGAADRQKVREHIAACPQCAAAARLERGLVKRLRATVGADEAPAGLADKIRSSLSLETPLIGEQKPEAPSPARQPTTQELPAHRMRRGAAWGTLLAAAAILLMLIALPWGSSGPGLVQAMAAEHHRRLDGDQYKLSLLSTEDVRIETFLSKELGTPVALPRDSVPARKGACVCTLGGHKSGIVGSFCKQRGKAVTVFVVRAKGLDLRGLELARRSGHELAYGSSGTCTAVIWRRGELCYALVGDLQVEALLKMATRAAEALDGKDAPRPAGLPCGCGCADGNCRDTKPKSPAHRKSSG